MSLSGILTGLYDISNLSSRCLACEGLEESPLRHLIAHLSTKCRLSLQYWGLSFLTAEARSCLSDEKSEDGVTVRLRSEGSLGQLEGVEQVLIVCLAHVDVQTLKGVSERYALIWLKVKALARETLYDRLEGDIALNRCLVIRWASSLLTLAVFSFVAVLRLRSWHYLCLDVGDEISGGCPLVFENNLHRD